MPQNNVPLINGKAYAWANVSFMLNGTPIIGISSISYDDVEDKTNGYGAGKYPIDRGEGNYEAKSSITLRAATVEKITSVAPGGRLQDYGVFDILVSYLVGTDKVTHRIRSVEFTGNKRDIKSGDQIIDVELPLIISHIEWK